MILVYIQYLSNTEMHTKILTLPRVVLRDIEHGIVHVVCQYMFCRGNLTWGATQCCAYIFSSRTPRNDDCAHLSSHLRRLWCRVCVVTSLWVQWSVKLTLHVLPPFHILSQFCARHCHGIVNVIGVTTGSKTSRDLTVSSTSVSYIVLLFFFRFA